MVRVCGNKRITSWARCRVRRRVFLVRPVGRNSFTSVGCRAVDGTALPDHPDDAVACHRDIPDLIQGNGSEGGSKAPPVPIDLTAFGHPKGLVRAGIKARDLAIGVWIRLEAREVAEVPNAVIPTKVDAPLRDALVKKQRGLGIVAEPTEQDPAGTGDGEAGRAHVFDGGSQESLGHRRDESPRVACGLAVNASRRALSRDPNPRVRGPDIFRPAWKFRITAVSVAPIDLVERIDNVNHARFGDGNILGFAGLSLPVQVFPLVDLPGAAVGAARDPRAAVACGADLGGAPANLFDLV